MVKGVNRSVKKKRDTKKPVISYCHGSGRFGEGGVWLLKVG